MLQVLIQRLKLVQVVLVRGVEIVVASRGNLYVKCKAHVFVLTIILQEHA